MYYKAIKRTFDICLSLCGIIFLSPVFLIVAVLVKISVNGPVIFRQERVGRDWCIFEIKKFRTMIYNAENIGPSISCDNDSRITPLGKTLRRFKLDELPQLVNVLKGEMSFVGPRPELFRYADKYRQEYDEILRVKPGITDEASIIFVEEASCFKDVKNVETFYEKQILPIKLHYQMIYSKKKSVIYDFSIILRTLAAILKGHKKKNVKLEMYTSLYD